MTAVLVDRSLQDAALEVLRRSGNPFRNYFARNPDDEVCARYHVPELFAAEREQLLGVVDLYRYDPTTHSESRPGARQQGRRQDAPAALDQARRRGAWQLLVTPGIYQKDTDFLEYLLFQIIDTLLGGGKQKGTRPLEYIGEELARRLLAPALRALRARTSSSTCFRRPAWAAGRAGSASARPQAQERTQWLIENLSRPSSRGRAFASLAAACAEAGLDRRARLRARVQPRRAHRGAQHRRADAPPHLPGLRPRRACSATRPTWPTSSPTASPSWSSTSGRAGRTWCWRCSRC